MTGKSICIAGKLVHFRRLVTEAEHAFDVPEHVERIGDGGIGGWQLRYGEWTVFPDEVGGRADPAVALALAVAEMEFRLNTLGK